MEPYRAQPVQWDGMNVVSFFPNGKKQLGREVGSDDFRGQTSGEAKSQLKFSRQRCCKMKMIQAVTNSSPSWRSLNHPKKGHLAIEKGHLTTEKGHVNSPSQKRSPAELPGGR